MQDKAEPSNAVVITTPRYSDAERYALSCDALWIFCRTLHPNVEGQTVPQWSAWVSETGEKSCQQSTVDYMSPVFAPITENSTVQHILKEASKEVHQQYV